MDSQDSSEKNYSVPYRYIPKVIDLDLYEKLREEIPFLRDKIPNSYSTETSDERRETAWLTSTNLSAQYSGKTMEPIPFTSTVLLVKKMVENILKVEFDSALCFLYVKTNDSMGFHDDRAGVSKGTDIVTVTFGSMRILAIRNNETLQKEFFELSNGDLFYMFADCQQKYKHAIQMPDTKNPFTGPRIAISFRRMMI